MTVFKCRQFCVCCVQRRTRIWIELTSEALKILCLLRAEEDEPPAPQHRECLQLLRHCLQLHKAPPVGSLTKRSQACRAAPQVTGTGCSCWCTALQFRTTRLVLIPIRMCAVYFCMGQWCFVPVHSAVQGAAGLRSPMPNEPNILIGISIACAAVFADVTWAAHHKP